MAQDAAEIVIAKGGSINTAPSGTALPSDTDPRAALDPLFNEAGHVTDPGAKLSAALTLTEIMAWTSARPVRRDVNTREFQLAFGLEQWNAPNLTLAFGGGTAITTAAGVSRYDFPSDEDALDEVALVVDWEDSGFEWRLVFESGNVTEGVETDLVRTAAAILPVTYKALEVAPFLITDAPSFGTAS